MNIDIGINEKDRAEIANGLSKLLADGWEKARPQLPNNPGDRATD